MSKLCIFIDESGTLERTETKPLIAGYIFREDNNYFYEDCNKKINEIAKKYKINSSMFHCTELKRRKPGAVEELFNFLNYAANYQIFYILYRKGLELEDSADEQNNILKNYIHRSRYMRMLYSLIYTLLFHTKITDKIDFVDICIAERSNYQITGEHIEGSIMAIIEEAIKKGKKFNVKARALNINESNENGLRIADFINHAIYLKERDNDNKYYKKIENKIVYDFEYSNRQNLFIQISDLFLTNSYSNGIILYHKEKNKFKENSYYYQRLEELLKNAYKNKDKWEDTDFYKILNYAEKMVYSGNKRKKLSAGKDILFSIEGILNKLSSSKKIDDKIKPLKFRTYQNILRWANHTSDYKIWLEFSKKGLELSKDLKTDATHYRDIMSFNNIMFNGRANYYSFEEAILELEDTIEYVNFINGAISEFNKIKEEEIKNPDTGKLLGSLGQNYAFQADIYRTRGNMEKVKVYSEKARECFEKALSNFTSHSDRSFHYTNLAHLALDNGLTDEAFQWIGKITHNYENPSELLKVVFENEEEPKVYFLHLILRAFNLKRDGQLNKFLLGEMDKYCQLLYKEPIFSQHPMQLIFINLSEILMKLDGGAPAIKNYLEKSIEICRKKGRPAINVMEIKGHILLAKHYCFKRQEETIRKELKEALKIYEEFLYITPPLTDILYTDNSGNVGGHFKPYYEQLKKFLQNWKYPFRESIFEEIIPRYPFNYE